MGTLLDSLAEPDHRRLLEWWLAARRGRPMPSRGDFDPVDHTLLLPRLFLVSVSPTAPHFRYRLCGTEIDSQQGYSMTGHTFEDLFSGELLRFTQERFRDVAFNGRISYHSTWFSSDNRARTMRFSRLLVPLSDDGSTVDMILGCRLQASPDRRSFADLAGSGVLQQQYEVITVDVAAVDRQPVDRLTGDGSAAGAFVA